MTMKAARPNLALVQPAPSDEKAELRRLHDLEPRIRDLKRAATIAFEMTMKALEGDDDDSLALFAIEQTEKLAAELCKQFYATSECKAVRS
jgi:hypothetical protein